MPIKKANMAGCGNDKAAPIQEADREYQLLTEWLALNRYDDDTPRETSTLLIFCQEGQWKGLLRDRDNERCLWMAARGFKDLLSLLDTALQEAELLEWRADRQSGAPTAKRLKRDA